MNSFRPWLCVVSDNSCAICCWLLKPRVYAFVAMHCPYHRYLILSTILTSHFILRSLPQNRMGTKTWLACRCSKLISFWHRGTYVQRVEFQVVFLNEYTTRAGKDASCIITGFIIIAGLIRA